MILIPRLFVVFGEDKEATYSANSFYFCIHANESRGDFSQTDYFNDRGVVKSALKMYKDAIKDYDRSIQLEPNQKAYANRGFAYSSLNLHNKAIEDYTRPLAINPNDKEVYYYRGVSYKAIGKIKGACDDLNKSRIVGFGEAIDLLKSLNCN